MIRRGNYNNQTLLVPPEQVEQVQAAFPGKTVVAEIGGTDKVPVKSQALSKAEAKELQLQTQETGAVQEVSWSAYDAKMVAKFVGKQAAVAGVLGAATATGFHIAGRLMNGEEIDAEEAVGIALETGADTGLKAAVAGAVKVGSEKGMIGLIPPGTSMPLIVNIVCISIHYYHSSMFGYGRRRANFGCSMDAEQSNLDEIKSVAMAFGFTPEEIDHLAAEGFSADELEEVLYGYGGEL